MSGQKNMLDVKILDRELRVACPEDEREALLSAVAYLDKKMTEIRDAGKIVNVERIAIMAALNIAHELLSTKVGRGVDLSDLTRRMTAMQTAIDQALAEQDNLF
ncbi:MAG TPA: cell division protein ZapA [Gallionella sp.]|jgi:cell division protein ZapA|nr:cell division protein ZapA [Gallionella sp.]OGS66326.1 MAG: cell division protein ZapA [Gallionellales bacterium GWA2_54_124]OGT20656.1 MAG: cell division protein ZapA [Gallionellales bacterium RIFOXYD12_FULL_53_10]OGT45582.1 MAG: cell division protein ZapA [Gallionellales bacterium RIFOXYD2_FULL_52_7]HCI52717.1 cell division protein ZapA [Gallionella sp.]